MGIFQKSVLDKYFKEIDKKIIQSSYEKFKTVFCNAENIKNIEASKEEQYQEGFLRELFVDCLGYTINPNPSFNLTTEFKNISDSRKADGAIIKDDKPIGIIELKGTGTFDLKTVEKQAFEYRYAHPTCKYIITSNFKELRFYIDTYESYEEFTLFNMEYNDFERLYISLSKESIFNDKPLKMKTDSKLKEEDISDKLYKDYHNFKMNIFNSMVKNNQDINKVELLKKSQKLLDRILFIFFAEDRGLLPPNTISKIITENKEQADIGREEPLYNTYKIYFSHIDKGNDRLDISEYNGGLFAQDPLLDNLIIEDVVLKDDALKLSTYNFSTDIDVNILGHIFENSLNDIDELHAEVTGAEFDKSKTKRKKDGVFYTPSYITKYIVDNTVGALCEEKKKELNLFDIVLDTEKEYKRLTKGKQAILDNLHKYRDFLSSLKILDPACGSGAFLNQALEYLIGEHKFIDLYRRPLEGDYLGFYDVRSSILENNLYGVDINEESVELARLSLWLRTAERGRKLNNLSDNIKCGNSLIDDESVAGELAFKWDEEFPEIMANGGFDVVIGNPPYVVLSSFKNQEFSFLQNAYPTSYGRLNTFALFLEKISKSLLKNKHKIGLIIPDSLCLIDYYTDLRKLLLDSHSLKTIIELGDGIFDEAVVPSIIIIMNNKVENNIIKIGFGKSVFEKNIYSVIDQDYYYHTPKYSFNLHVDKIFIKLNNLIDNKSFFKLKDVIQMKIGICTGANDKHISDGPVFRNSKKLLQGKDINRYSLKYDTKFINYDRKDLLRARDESIFLLKEKLFMRQTSDKLILSYDEEQYYAIDSLFILYTIDQNLNLKYCLCLLNSKLLNRQYQKLNPETGRVFAQVKIDYVNELPIATILKEYQSPFIEKADAMLSLNKSFIEKKTEFTEWLKTEFSITEISNKLDSFYELDFDGMKAELKKKMPKGKDLVPKEIGLLKKHYEEYKPKLLAVKNDIDKTDSEIDKMVYELYGLTDEEIRIVEDRC